MESILKLSNFDTCIYSYFQSLCTGKWHVNFVQGTKSNKEMFRPGLAMRPGRQWALSPCDQFHKAASAQKAAKHNQIMLTRKRLPSKTLCHMYSLWLVSCSIWLSRQFLSTFFCQAALWNLGPLSWKYSLKMKMALPSQRWNSRPECLQNSSCLVYLLVGCFSNAKQQTICH